MWEIKENFSDEVANVQENMDSSTQQLSQEKQAAQNRVKEKTDIPLVNGDALNNMLDNLPENKNE